MRPTHEPQLSILAVRYLLPATLVVSGGAVWLAAGSEEMVGLGQALIGAAGIVVVANLFIRLSIASNADHDRATRRPGAAGAPGGSSQHEQRVPRLVRWALPVALCAIGAAIWAAASATPLTAVGIALLAMGVLGMWAFSHPAS